MYRLTVSLARMVPPTRRQVEVPSEVSLAEVAGRAGKVISYTYDLGACWEHRIVVDAVEPARAGTRFARCVAGVGPHPAEYDHDRPRRLDLDALNKQLAKLPLQRKAPASAPAQAAATPQVRTLAADARRARLL